MRLSDYRKIDARVNEAIKAALAPFGLKVDGISTGVAELDGTVRITVKASDANLKDKDGNATTAEAERFKRNAVPCNLDPAWLGQTFPAGRESFKVLGMREGRSAKCVVIERVSDGSRRVCEPEMVRAYMKLAEKTGPRERKDLAAALAR